MTTQMTVLTTFTEEIDSMPVYLLAIRALDVNLGCSPVKHIDLRAPRYTDRHSVCDRKKKEFGADAWFYPAHLCAVTVKRV
jgi:hypothetical protein